MDRSATEPPGTAVKRPWMPMLLLVLAALAVVASVSVWATAGSAPDSEGIARRVVISEDSVSDGRDDFEFLRPGGAPDGRFDLAQFDAALLPGEMEVTLTLAEPLPQGVSLDDQSIRFYVAVIMPGETPMSLRIENTSDGAWGAWLEQWNEEVLEVQVALEPPVVEGRTLRARVPTELFPSQKGWRLAAMSRVTVADSDLEDDLGWVDRLPDESRLDPDDDWLRLHP
jgi:hypothetical protein